MSEERDSEYWMNASIEDELIYEAEEELKDKSKHEIEDETTAAKKS